MECVLHKLRLCSCRCRLRPSVELSTRSVVDCIQSKRDPQIIAQCRRWSLTQMSCKRREREEKKHLPRQNSQPASQPAIRSMTNRRRMQCSLKCSSFYDKKHSQFLKTKRKIHFWYKSKDPKPSINAIIPRKKTDFKNAKKNRNVFLMKWNGIMFQIKILNGPSKM